MSQLGFKHQPSLAELSLAQTVILEMISLITWKIDIYLITSRISSFSESFSLGIIFTSTQFGFAKIFQKVYHQLVSHLIMQILNVTRDLHIDPFISFSENVLASSQSKEEIYPQSEQPRHSAITPTCYQCVSTHYFSYHYFVLYQVRIHNNEW